jgi:signal peptidase I
MKRKLLLLAVLAAVVVGGGGWFITPMVVVGDSMLPTLRSWDVCWMRRVRQYEPVRGDVIMFRTADDPPLRFIKRVIALPGETIAITNGTVLIQHQPLAEPYTPGNRDWVLNETNVPPGKVYVIGDNRDGPPDLSVHGLVAIRLVQARLIAFWRWRK